jgi:hypothetical protein
VTYTIVVDGLNAGNVDAFTLTLTLTPAAP